MIFRTKRTVALLLVLLLATLATPAAAVPTPFADFDQYVLQAMADWGAPGVAIGIEKDGKVLYAKGFGLRNVEQNLPVTTDTLFGIASTTKAFTATAFQMLVEEGTLDWDRPVRDYIPGFRLKDPFVQERVTARDWAAHRTGLNGADVPLMFNPDLDLAYFLRNLQHVDSHYEFRSQYLYNNLGYVMLGHLMEQTTGTSWERLITERLLGPLGMQRTVLSLEDLQGSLDYALPYIPRDGKGELASFTPVKHAAPAGAIFSSVADMLKWVGLNLNQGKVGDAQLVSPAGMAAIHTTQMIRPAPAGQMEGYGLGWYTEYYRGHYYVYHSGRNPGYGAMVSLLPQERIGVVVLTNGDASPMLNVLAQAAMDRALGLDFVDWNAQIKQEAAGHTSTQAPPAQGDTTPLHPLDDYAGEYGHDLYGVVKIEHPEGGLQAVYYSTTIPLTHQGYDHFSGPLSKQMPEPVQIHFITTRSGEVNQVEIEFLPGERHVFHRRPPAQLYDPAFLALLAGQYDMAGQALEVRLDRSVLTLTVPGQRPYTLVPDLGRGFRLKEEPGIAISFVQAESNAPADTLVISAAGYRAEFGRLK